MKTRSQTRKEKHDNEKPKIPQLNEDVLGIILKHTIEKQQEYVLNTYEIIEDHLKILLEVQDDVIDIDMSSADGAFNKVQWPDYLNSNSRRLIYHTQVKLFPTYKLTMPPKVDEIIKTRLEMDLLWVTLKHFGTIRSWDGNYLAAYGTVGYAAYSSKQAFQRLWKRIRDQRKRQSLFRRKLEERLICNGTGAVSQSN